MDRRQGLRPVVLGETGRQVVTGQTYALARQREVAKAPSPDRVSRACGPVFLNSRHIDVNEAAAPDCWQCAYLGTPNASNDPFEAVEVLHLSSTEAAPRYCQLGTGICRLNVDGFLTQVQILSGRTSKPAGKSCRVLNLNSSSRRQDPSCRRYSKPRPRRYLVR